MPECFQKRMQKILLGLKGVIWMINNILMHGCDQEEHNSRQARATSTTIYKDKCSFSIVDRVTFLGHMLLITQEYILTQRKLKQSG